MVCGVVLVDVLLCDAGLNELVVVHARLDLRESSEAIVDELEYRASEVGIVFEDIVAVVDLGVDILFDDFENNHNFVVEEREHGRFAFGSAALVFFADAFVDTGEFGVAIVFFDEGVVASLQVA